MNRYEHTLDQIDDFERQRVQSRKLMDQIEEFKKERDQRQRDAKANQSQLESYDELLGGE